MDRPPCPSQLVKFIQIAAQRARRTSTIIPRDKSRRSTPPAWWHRNATTHLGAVSQLIPEQRTILPRDSTTTISTKRQAIQRRACWLASRPSKRIATTGRLGSSAPITILFPTRCWVPLGALAEMIFIPPRLPSGALLGLSLAAARIICRPFSLLTCASTRAALRLNRRLWRPLVHASACAPRVLRLQRVSGRALERRRST